VTKRTKRLKPNSAFRTKRPATWDSSGHHRRPSSFPARRELVRARSGPGSYVVCGEVMAVTKGLTFDRDRSEDTWAPCGIRLRASEPSGNLTGELARKERVVLWQLGAM
jgi:hypothetical protein